MRSAQARIALYAAVLASLASADIAGAADKLRRIGVLSLTGPTANQEGFREGLRELGYVDGKNVVLEYRFAHDDADRLDRYARELVESGVDVILAISPPGATAAQKATRTVPIVFFSISDPVGMGLAQSLARPGGNITGVANMPADLNIKRLQLLRDAFPAMRKVAILSRSGNPNHQLHLVSQQQAAAGLKFEAKIFNIAGPGEFEAAFGRMAKDGIQAVVAVQDVLFYAHRQAMMDAAARHGVIVVADGREYAEAGALFSYGTRYYTLYKRGAITVDKVLRGENPAEIPIEQPLEIELVVNLRVAGALGVKVPQLLLTRANLVLR